jgi:hypothetical protein
MKFVPRKIPHLIATKIEDVCPMQPPPKPVKPRRDWLHPVYPIR